jgi:hypothetical protein
MFDSSSESSTDAIYDVEKIGAKNNFYACMQPF